MIASYITKTSATDVDNSVLAEVLAASSDACWCMEFGIAVDLTAPDLEVVRQVFENDPVWRLHNPAMARLYLLPADQDFGARPVREIFPRNRQNEEFVLNLIANGFEVDAAPALDIRYDGVEIEVENDVRAHIEDGRLIRMFGIVRDVGKHRRREAALQADLTNWQVVLNAIPVPVVAVDQGGNVVIANRAAEQGLSVSRTELPGQKLADVLASGFDENTAGRVNKLTAEMIDTFVPATKYVELEDRERCWSVTTSGISGNIAAVLTLTSGAPHYA